MTSSDHRYVIDKWRAIRIKLRTDAINVIIFISDKSYEVGKLACRPQPRGPSILSSIFRCTQGTIRTFNVAYKSGKIRTTGVAIAGVAVIS